MVKLKEIVQKMTSRRLNIVCLWKIKLVDEKSREIELDWEEQSQLTHPPNLGRAKITLTSSKNVQGDNKKYDVGLD